MPRFCPDALRITTQVVSSRLAQAETARPKQVLVPETWRIK